jgi:DNA-binding CsgD family transcriptional regulator
MAATKPLEKAAELPSSRYGYSLQSNSLGPTDLLDMLLRHLEEEHNFSRNQLSQMIDERKQSALIPASIFTRRLSGLESIVKYLAENLELRNSEIAKLLNRDIRTVWKTHKNATKKYPSRFSLAEHEPYLIPASEFSGRRLSILETLATYLKKRYSLSTPEIARILKRDDSTIWTVCRRAKQKQSNLLDSQVDY